MRCPNCQNELPENARFCPICGASMDDYTQKVRPAVETEEATVRSDNPIFVNVPEETPVPQEIPEEAPVPQEVPVPEEVPAEPEAWTPDVEAVPMQLNVSGEEQPVKKEKKPGKKKRVVLIVSIVLAVALVVTCLLGFLVFDWGLYIRDAVERQKDPVEYKDIVEERALAGGSVTELTLMKNWVLEIYDGMVELGQKGGQDVTVKLTMDDNLRSLLKLFVDQESPLGTIVNDLDQVDVKLSQNAQEKAHQLKLTISGNQVDIVSLDVIMNRQNKKVYATLPELNDTYLELSDPENPLFMLVPVMQMLDNGMDLYSQLPSRASVEKALDNCILDMLACIKNVKKSDKTLKAAGVKQDVTVLTYRINQKTYKQMALVLVKALQEDPTLQILVEAVYGYVENLSGNEPESLDAVYRQMEETEATDELLLRIDTYVNHKGQIVGRKFCPEGEDVEMEYGILANGKDIGICAEIYDGNQQLVMEGKGAWEKDALQATLAVTVDDEELLVLELANMDIKSLRGNLTVRLGEDMKDEARDLLDIPMNAVDLGELCLKLNLKKDAVSAVAGAGDMDALFVNATVKRRDAAKVQLPEKTTANLYSWGGTAVMRLGTLQDNLKKANLEALSELLMNVVKEMLMSQMAY